MRSWHKVFFIGLITVFSSNSFATNGLNLIGLGAKSRGMGGIGTAQNVGVENMLKNPALLDVQDKANIEFMATYMSVSVQTENKDADLIGKTPKKYKSANDSAMLPGVGFVYKLTDKVNWGLGVFAVAGIGVDFREENGEHGLSKMHTSLGLMKLTPTVKYQVNEDLSLGFGLQSMRGDMSVSYNAGSDTGRGSSNYTGYGYDLGVAYKHGGFTYGLNYQSEIFMKYKYQIAAAAEDFGAGDIVGSDKLVHPAETSLGLAYEADNWTASVDYRQVNWSKSDGHSEIGWDDQNIIAVGGSYKQGKNTYRLGYNYAKSPLGKNALENKASASPKNKQSLNLLNIVGMPALSQTHYTAGYSRNFTESFSMDFAYVSVAAETESAKYNAGTGDMEVETTIELSSFTASANWLF